MMDHAEFPGRRSEDGLAIKEETIMSFETLGLSPSTFAAIQKLGFEKPTPIQQGAIPLMLEGRDVIGSAQTGTGKTAAFGLPILSKLGESTGKIRALVMVPTRELANQVELAMQDFAKGSNIRIAPIYGGVGYGQQIFNLKKGLDIVVATPGRLLDHLEKGTCKLDHLQFLVLDEADRMLDMGFLPDVRRIIQQCPKQRQTALFSATIPPEIEGLVKWAMNKPETIQIGQRRSPAETVKQFVYPVAEEQKLDLLQALLEKIDYRSVIVFCRTKHGADRISKFLKKNNHTAAVLHSNRTQREREQALKGFRDGRFELLVATDIAARGLDVPEVSHVINYDVPQHPEDYVHRIGRTGRAEAEGDALTIMVASDAQHVGAIERFIGKKIDRTKLESFNYKHTVLFDASKREELGARRRILGIRLSGGYYFGKARKKR